MTQSRSTAVLFALAGHSRSGLRLKQISEESSFPVTAPTGRHDDPDESL